MSATGQYRVILVDADTTVAGDRRMRCAAQLASGFGAILSGLKAADLHTFYPVEDVGFALEKLIAAEKSEIEADAAAARAVLQRIAAEQKVGSEWRAVLAPPTDAFIRHARGVDLLVVASLANDTRGSHRRPSIGSLVMEAGRPVLVVPPSGGKAEFRKVAVAWKDTRECRRALIDSLPLLKMAETVTLVTVCEEADKAESRTHLSEVKAYLHHHGVEARLSIRSGDPEDIIPRLCRSNDLVVAGAYGHSRFREWVFGGVTDSLLGGAECCVFLSH